MRWSDHNSRPCGAPEAPPVAPLKRRLRIVTDRHAKTVVEFLAEGGTGPLPARPPGTRARLAPISANQPVAWKQLRRFRVKRLFALGLWSVLALGLISPAAAAEPGAGRAAPAVGARTYAVLVGAEDARRGIDVMAFFPDSLRVHVGDTVHWAQNSNEIHTVTFLAGGATPDLIVPAPQPNGLSSPLMINPTVGFPAAPAGGQYDGSTYANSGIMSLDPGQPTSFDLTFTRAGTYSYLCVVHGQMMSGTVVVVDASVPIPSPRRVSQDARRQVAQAMKQAPVAIRTARSLVPPPTRNSDGTMTYHIGVGFSSGQIDLMRFFPGKLVVHPGDTVVWTLNSPPHSITFLNGNADVEFIVPTPQSSGPPLLLLNPQALGPVNAGQPLTGQGVFNSGVLGFGPPPWTFSLKIGNVSGELPYLCLLHDTSGMVGSLVVVPRDRHDRER
jgi:plastocyanin